MHVPNFVKRLARRGKRAAGARRGGRIQSYKVLGNKEITKVMLRPILELNFKFKAVWWPEGDCANG